MSILGKIVGQLESSSLGDYIILPSYNSNTKITDFTLPENSVFKIEKGFDEEKQIYNWLSINSTEVSLTVNNIVPTEEGVSDGNRTIYMIQDNNAKKTYIKATTGDFWSNGYLMFKNIKIDGVSYPDETFNIDLTPPARHQGW